MWLLIPGKQVQYFSRVQYIWSPAILSGSSPQFPSPSKSSRYARPLTNPWQPLARRSMESRRVVGGNSAENSMLIGWRRGGRRQSRHRREMKCAEGAGMWGTRCVQRTTSALSAGLPKAILEFGGPVNWHGLATHKLTMFEKGPTNAGMKFDNSLPLEIKNKTSRNFKNDLKVWCVEKCFYSVEEFYWQDL